MIDYKELRIGNLVINSFKKYNGFPNYYSRISQISEYIEVNIFAESYPNGSSQFPLEMLEPIPLTEDILLKCGFVIFEGWDDMVFYREKNWKPMNEFFELEQTDKGFIFDFRNQNINTFTNYKTYISH